jgi:pimeloyl-ACP methyl ester carboxylesterase
MKLKKLILLGLISTCSTNLYSSELIQITLADGEVVTGKLDLPANEKNIKELIIFVQSSGPHTYLDTRGRGDGKFNYFDLFVSEFNKRGVAFFVYNRRGVTIGNKPPYYDSIDKEKYSKYLPSNEADDVSVVINQLKKDKRLRRAKIVLFGWSEGTVIAAMVADQKKAKVDALFLAGYCNDTMTDIIKWQHSGDPTIKTIGDYFDPDENNIITRPEYESEEKRAASYRKNVFKDTKFDLLDANKDSVLTKEDFKANVEPKLKALLDAIARNDDDWIWKNYFRITSTWVKEHDKLEPNKVRMLRLNMPIYIFQGSIDANTSVDGVYDIKGRFKENGKSNLTTFVFKQHNHDLNYGEWISKKSISEGIAKIFEVAAALK